MPSKFKTGDKVRHTPSRIDALDLAFKEHKGKFGEPTVISSVWDNGVHTKLTDKLIYPNFGSNDNDVILLPKIVVLVRRNKNEDDQNASL